MDNEQDGFNLTAQQNTSLSRIQKAGKNQNMIGHDFTVTKAKRTLFATYKINGKGTQQSPISLNPKKHSDWKKLGKQQILRNLDAVVPEYQYKNRYVIYFGEKI